MVLLETSIIKHNSRYSQFMSKMSLPKCLSLKSRVKVWFVYQKMMISSVEILLESQNLTILTFAHAHQNINQADQSLLQVKAPITELFQLTKLMLFCEPFSIALISPKSNRPICACQVESVDQTRQVQPINLFMIFTSDLNQTTPPLHHSTLRAYNFHLLSLLLVFMLPLNYELNNTGVLG